MKNLVLFVAYIMLLGMLSAHAQNMEKFTLTVKLDKQEKITFVFLAYQIEGRKILDSAKIKNGVFEFVGEVSQALSATLIADHEGIGSEEIIRRAKTSDKNDAIKFYLHPGKFHLTATRFVKDGVFSGSIINADNERLKASLKPIFDQLIILDRQFTTGSYLVGKQLTPSDSIRLKKALLKSIDSLNASMTPIKQKFVHDNPNSYVSLPTLMSIAGSFPDVKVIGPLFDKLSAAVRNTPQGISYAKFLSDRINLVSGVKAPNFMQNDVKGIPISLSSFKGKYVLLDFWASWCGPCRTESPALVKLFNDFKDKNFTILGISLDAADGREDWVKAIRDDGLVWTQVSDLKRWDNEVVKLYSVRAIPQSFLIDPNGIILAKGLSITDLRKKLNEIFKQ